MQRSSADKAETGRPATREELWDKIKDYDEWAVGALIRLFSLQEEDEKLSHSTRKLNSVGFNAYDAKDMTSIANFYLSRKFLTKNQLKYVRRTMAKYCNQLLAVGMEPLPLIYASKKEEHWIEQKWAGLTDNGTSVLIKFRFPKSEKEKFESTKAAVKTIPGRRWNPDEKAWIAPLGIEAVQTLIALDFDVAPKLEEWYEKMTREVDDTGLKIPGLKLELYPFQRKGVAFIEDREGRALIADDMGLGKTAQALAWLMLRKEESLPALVVTPANVKMKWGREIDKWTDIPYWILSGRDHHQKMPSAKLGTGSTDGKDITLINYDIVDGWLEILQGVGFKTVILDEVHYIKNSKALRTKAIKKLSKKADYLIELSGTPITNRPIEFWNALSILRKDLFPYYWGFVNKYCGGYQQQVYVKGKFGQPTTRTVTDKKGASNTKELHEILTKTIMLRRKKSEVLPDLPDKTISVIPIPIDNRDEYDRAEANLALWIAEQEGKIVSKDYPIWLARFEKLKQIAARGKIKAALNWIEDFLVTGEKLVTFAVHHEILDTLNEYPFETKSVKIDGRTPTNKRDEIAQQFQTDEEIGLFIGGLRAVKEGMDLFAASNSCFLELGWTPGEHNQAEDRLHRIGQKNAVTAWYLVAENTIEEEIAEILDEKRAVLTMILDGEEVDQGSLLTELLKRFKKEQD